MPGPAVGFGFVVGAAVAVADGAGDADDTPGALAIADALGLAAVAGVSAREPQATASRTTARRKGMPD